MRRRRRPFSFSSIKWLRGVGAFILLIFLLTAMVGVVSYYENKGELKDINFVLNSIRDKSAVIEVWGLEWYLERLVAHKLTEPSLDSDLILNYQYLDTVINKSRSTRALSDFKFAFYTLQRSFVEKYPRLIVSLIDFKKDVASFLKLFSYYFNAGSRLSFSANNKAVEYLISIREDGRDLRGDKLKSYYESQIEKIQSDKELNILKPYLLFQLARSVFPEDSKRTAEYLASIRTDDKAPVYLRKISELIVEGIRESGDQIQKLEFHDQKIEKGYLSKIDASEIFDVLQLLFDGVRFGLVSSLLTEINLDEFPENGRERLLLIKGWLEMVLGNLSISKETLVEVTAFSKNEDIKFLGQYFLKLLNFKQENFELFAGELGELAEGYKSSAANLKYQEWGALYFDVKDSVKASEILAELRIENPGSLWGYPGKGAEIFKPQTPDQALLVFNVFAPLIPQAVYLFKTRVGLLAQRVQEDEFVRKYSEAEFDEFIMKKLREKAPRILSDLRVYITEAGFHGDAFLKLFFIEIPVTGAGMVNVDELNENKLYLDIYWAKIGNLPMPKFLLYNLESFFLETANKGNMPLEILKMEYEDKGIVIECRKTENATGASMLNGVKMAVSKREYSY